MQLMLLLIKNGFLNGIYQDYSGNTRDTYVDENTALGGYTGIVQVYNPSVDYTSESSTYYMYGIRSAGLCNYASDASTLDNFQSVGLDWYKQLNKPTTVIDYWDIDRLELFGGPLCVVYHNCNNDTYGFECYTSENHRVPSSDSSYWGGDVMCMVQLTLPLYGQNKYGGYNYE